MDGNWNQLGTVNGWQLKPDNHKTSTHSWYTQLGTRQPQDLNSLMIHTIRDRPGSENHTKFKTDTTKPHICNCCQGNRGRETVKQSQGHFPKERLCFHLSKQWNHTPSPSPPPPVPWTPHWFPLKTADPRRVLTFDVQCISQSVSVITFLHATATNGSVLSKWTKQKSVKGQFFYHSSYKNRVRTCIFNDTDALQN